MNARDCKDVEDTEDCANVDETIERSTAINERTKREKSIGKSEEEVSSPDTGKFSRKGERSGKEQEDSGQEHSTPRISLIKPPRILAKFISPETRPSPTKHGERKSNIPIFKRSSKEFEDIRSPQESPKRSLIPQRYIIPSCSLRIMNLTKESIHKCKSHILQFILYNVIFESHFFTESFYDRNRLINKK